MCSQTCSLPMEIRILRIEKFQGRGNLLPCERLTRSTMGKETQVGDQRAPGPGRRRPGQAAIRLRIRAPSIPGSTRAEIRPGVYFRSYQATGYGEQEPASFPPVRTHAVNLIRACRCFCQRRVARLSVLKTDRRAAQHEMRHISPAQMQSILPRKVDARGHILGNKQSMA
jgi:hypothetical protein